MGDSFGPSDCTTRGGQTNDITCRELKTWLRIEGCDNIGFLENFFMTACCGKL